MSPSTTSTARIPASPITVVVAILASFVAFLDGSIVNVALPAIADDLGGGVSTQQWVVDGYLLTLGSLILVAGSLGDHIGRARTLRIGLVLFGLASVACAVAPDVEVLVAARILQGAGGALLVPSSLAMITAAFDQQARGRAVGAWTAWTSAAFILGPPLGGVLVDTVGWRWVFAVNVVPVAATLVAMRRFHDGPIVRPVRIDWLGAAFIALALGGIVFGLIELPASGWSDPFAVATLVAGAVLLVAFVWWERRTSEPLLPGDLFRSRNFTYGNVATAAIYAGVGLGVLIVTLYLQEVVGLSAGLAGIATLPVAVMSVLFSGLFGSLAGKHGPRLFMTAGPAIAAAGFFWMIGAGDATTDVWVRVIPGLVLYGLGLAVTVAPLTAAVLGSVPPDQSGVASAFNNAVSRVGGLVAVAAVGSIAGSAITADGFGRLALVTGACFLAGAVISFLGIRNEVIRSDGGAPGPADAIGPAGPHPGDRPQTTKER